MTQPRRWLDEIIDVIEGLGGQAHLSEIYAAIETRGKMTLHNTWQATIRRTIEIHSSDSNAFNGKEDLFYSVYGKGKGVWGLRSYPTSYITNDFKNAVSKMRERELEYFLENDSEEDVKALLDQLSSDGRISVKEGLIRIRKVSVKTITFLKNLYENKCQICGTDYFSQYQVSIVEAHHIEYFSKTQNHHPSNIMILCPNHHRLVHKLNAIFDRENAIFDREKEKIIYSNGIVEDLKINRHL